MAPDVSVYSEAPDHEADDLLGQLAFEVVIAQPLGDAAVKAAKLAGRGVRRVFATDVPRSPALEWSAVRAAWVELDPAGRIVDPALEVSLPIESLIHAARTDDHVARALIAKHNPGVRGHLGRGSRHEQSRRPRRGEGRGLAEGRPKALPRAR